MSSSPDWNARSREASEGTKRIRISRICGRPRKYWSCAASRPNCCGTYSAKAKGPVPIGRRRKPSLPIWSTAALQTMKPPA